MSEESSHDLVTYLPSDPSFPRISVPQGFTFSEKELKSLESVLKNQGIKVEKFGPIRLPLHLEGDQKIHFVVKCKAGKGVPVLFHLRSDKDPIGLELYLGQLAIWGKFGPAPVVVYSLAPLPEHFNFYLGPSPLAKVELGLRALYIYDLLPYIMKDVNLKKAEFITERVQDLLKRHLGLSFKMIDYVQIMASLNSALHSLNAQVPDRNERMRSNLKVATKMISFFFAKCLRFETGLEWTNRASYENHDLMQIVLKNGWLLDPDQVVDNAVKGNIPLQNVYTDLRNALQTGFVPQLARKPTPKKKEYVRRYFPAGTSEIIQASIRTIITEYAPLGLFRGTEWGSREMVREFAQKIHENRPAEKELPEYVFLYYLNQILNFDTEGSGEPDSMTGLAKDIFMLSKGDLIPSYFEADYDDVQGQYEIARLGLGGSPITVVADKAEGEVMVSEFVDCLNAYLSSRRMPARYYWVGFTDDQTACLAYLDRGIAERLLWARGWPIRLNPRPMDPFNYWLKYAQVNQFLSQASYPDFMKTLKTELGIDEPAFLADPGKALAELIVKLDGFTLDAGATSAEIMAAVSGKLKQIGMDLSVSEDAAAGLPADAAGKRYVPVSPDALPVDGAAGAFIKAINGPLAVWDIEMLEREMAPGILGYALTSRKCAKWMVRDGLLGFGKPGEHAGPERAAESDNAWTDYIR